MFIVYIFVYYFVCGYFPNGTVLYVLGLPTTDD